MDAQGKPLTSDDILKIWARKFIRLAPVYYSMWAIVWALTSRVLIGPISYNGNINMATCSSDWIWTLTMLGNIGVETMAPYQGCF